MIEKGKTFIKNPKIIIGFVLLLVLSLPVLVLQVLKQQDIRQRAASTAPAITLQFSPQTNTVVPGSTFNVDLLLNAGTDDIGSIHFKMVYDQALTQVTVLSTSGTALSPAIQTNTNGVFETTMLNPSATPVTGNGLKLITFQVKALTQGTAHLTVDPVIQATATGSDTYVPVDNANNIIGTYTISLDVGVTPTITVSPTITTGPTITVTPTVTIAPTVTSTPVPTATLTPTLTPTKTPTPSPTRIPTNTPIPSATPTPGPVTGGSVVLTAVLPGIGTNVSIGENTAPIHPTRKFTVYAVNSQNQVVATTMTDMNYNNGTYKGTATFNNLPDGPYTIKVSSDNSLIKAIPGIYLTLDAPAQAPPVNLVTGNIITSGDSGNLLDIDDYNALLACFNGSDCSSALRSSADLNDDGRIDEKDLNILLRGFAARQGD